ncbi:MAG: hypothetical protein CBD16_09545 [Betaproteobacteria bacterium TMED156]|nr:MAG: hypothetical protein CBD16_09545 [Betaproteobacteria bacterium TMED156]
MIVKINFNILKEQEGTKKEEKASAFNDLNIVYSNDFDEMVKIINKQANIKKGKKARGTVKPFSAGQELTAEDPETEIPELEATDDYEIEGRDDFDAKLVSKTTKKENDGDSETERDVIVPDKYQQYDSELLLEPESEDYESDSQSSHEIKVGQKTFFSVVYYNADDSDNKKLLGSIINIQNRGYLISHKKIDSENNTDFLTLIPDDLALSNWPKDSDKFKDFSYSYKNALRLFFKMQKSKIPEETLPIPENFKDPVNLPLKPIKYTKKTRNDNFNWYLVNNAVLMYNQDPNLNKGGEKIIIDEELEKTAHDQRYEKIKSLEEELQKTILVAGFNKTIKDISSLAAMIRIETSNVLEHSPFGAAAVAFYRVESEFWGDNFYDVLSGPIQQGKPGSVWNNSKSYKDAFQQHYSNIKSILYRETATGRDAADLPKINERYNNMKETDKNVYRLSIDYATTAIDKEEEIRKRYKQAMGFIHPEQMPKEYKNGSNNDTPFDFNKEVFISDQSTVYEIPNNPKTHGIKYVGKSVAQKILDKKVFYFPGETALFQKP